MKIYATGQGRVIEMKLDVIYFNDVKTGLKKFEIRREIECSFTAGDIIIAREYTHAGGVGYTGALILLRVTYVFRGPLYGSSE